MVGLCLVYTVGQCDIFEEIARGGTGVFADFLEKLKKYLTLWNKLVKSSCISQYTTK